MERNTSKPDRTAAERSLLLGSLTIVFVLMSCGPSIDPAAKRDIDARIANLRVSSTVVAAPPPGRLESMRPAVGQWVQYKVSLPDGRVKFVTKKIIGEHAGALWYERVDETYEGRVVQQLLFAVDDHADPAKVELRAARTKNEKGRVVTLSRPTMWQESYWAEAEAVAHIRRWPALPRETTVVPAGRFEGCYREHTVDDVWWHPNVPLSGLVRVEIGSGVTFELVAYGVTGARSDF